MEQLGEILNIPILQALGVVLLIGLAERIGVPVIATLKSLLKIEGGKNSDQLLDKMDVLSQHFNHDTTEQNERIIAGLDKICTKIEGVHDCLKKANGKLDEMQKYGIKNLKE